MIQIPLKSSLHSFLAVEVPNDFTKIIWNIDTLYYDSLGKNFHLQLQAGLELLGRLKTSSSGEIEVEFDCEEIIPSIEILQFNGHGYDIYQKSDFETPKESFASLFKQQAIEQGYSFGISNAEEPYPPFYMPYGMGEDQYRHEIKLASDRLAEFELQREEAESKNLCNKTFVILKLKSK